MRLRTPLLFAALLLTTAACSVSSPEDLRSAAPTGTTAQVTAVQVSDSVELAVEASTEAATFGPGPGTDATLTIGDQTWTFNTVLCTFQVAEGSDIPTGATISVLNDEFQLGISIHPEAGEFVDFGDFNFADPTISYSSGADTTRVTTDGETFGGTGEFVDRTTESPDLVPGSFSGTCR